MCVPLMYLGPNHYELTKLVLGKVMCRRQQDRRSPPKGLMLQLRLTEVSDLYDQIVGFMDDCPEPLKLDWDNDNRSIA
jgi:hypothetical protein